MNRQRKILIGLAVILLLAVGYAWYATPRQHFVSDATDVSGTDTSALPQTRPANENGLDIELLERSAQRYIPPERDLFNFVTPPPRKPKPEPVAVPTPQPKPQPQPPINPVTEREIKVQRSLARFVFLGYLLKDGQHTVFLSQGESLFLVHEGDDFGDKKEFHVVSITPEKMSISQSDVAGLIEIRLVEKEPLSPAFNARPEPPLRNTLPPPVTGNSQVPPPRPVPTINPGGQRTFIAPSPLQRSAP